MACFKENANLRSGSINERAKKEYMVKEKLQL
jgi:hypothetical protein